MLENALDSGGSCGGDPGRCSRPGTSPACTHETARYRVAVKECLRPPPGRVRHRARGPGASRRPRSPPRTVTASPSPSPRTLPRRRCRRPASPSARWYGGADAHPFTAGNGRCGRAIRKPRSKSTPRPTRAARSCMVSTPSPMTWISRSRPRGSARGRLDSFGLGLMANDVPPAAGDTSQGLARI